MTVAEKIAAIAPTLHYIDTFEKAGIYIIKPKAARPSRGVQIQQDTTISQTETLGAVMSLLVRDLGLKSIVWDTVTATADSLVSDAAYTAIHKTDKTKSLLVVDDSGKTVSYVPGQNWSDNNFAQRFARDNIRNPLMDCPCNVFLIGHLVTLSEGPEGDRSPVLHGFDAGGPSSIKSWGRDIPANMVLLMANSKKRILLVNPQTDRSGVMFATGVKGAHNKLEDRYDVPLTYEGCRDLMASVWKAMGVQRLKMSLAGLQRCGKTTLISSIFGLPDTKPVLVVAADGGEEEIPSWWPEVKEVRNES